MGARINRGIEWSLTLHNALDCVEAKVVWNFNGENCVYALSARIISHAAWRAWLAKHCCGFVDVLGTYLLLSLSPICAAVFTVRSDIIIDESSLVRDHEVTRSRGSCAVQLLAWSTYYARYFTLLVETCFQLPNRQHGSCREARII